MMPKKTGKNSTPGEPLPEQPVDEVEELVGMAIADPEVRSESARALAIFNNSNMLTKEQIGRTTLVQNKALVKAAEIAIETISRVSTERDPYKDMLGDTANDASVQSAISRKVRENRPEVKRSRAISELKRTIEQGQRALTKN
jgi:hypothetical protein